MGIHVLTGACEGRDCAAMVDSVTGWAFGPVFRSAWDLERWLSWTRRRLPGLGVRDLRELDEDDLRRLYAAEWITLPDCQWCGERCIGEQCEDHDAACTPRGELPALPLGLPDHDEPGVTRQRVMR